MNWLKEEFAALMYQIVCLGCISLNFHSYLVLSVEGHSMDFKKTRLGICCAGLFAKIHWLILFTSALLSPTMQICFNLNFTNQTVPTELYWNLTYIIWL